jgi:hypothetical protein
MLIPNLDTKHFIMSQFCVLNTEQTSEFCSTDVFFISVLVIFSTEIEYNVSLVNKTLLSFNEHYYLKLRNKCQAYARSY